MQLNNVIQELHAVLSTLTCSLNPVFWSSSLLSAVDNVNRLKMISLKLFFNPVPNIMRTRYEDLTLETTASESLYGGQFTLSTQLIKPNYLIRYHILLPSCLVFASFSTAGPSNTAFRASTLTTYSVSLSRPPAFQFVVPGTVTLTFFISTLPFSMTTRYAVTGHPPSSAGAAHFTVSEVAWMFRCAMVGEPGFPSRTKKYGQYIF